MFCEVSLFGEPCSGNADFGLFLDPLGRPRLRRRMVPSGNYTFRSKIQHFVKTNRVPSSNTIKYKIQTEALKATKLKNNLQVPTVLQWDFSRSLIKDIYMSS